MSCAATKAICYATSAALKKIVLMGKALPDQVNQLVGGA